MSPLGYLFWHAPRPGVATDRYEAACRTWQAALAEHPPVGFLSATTWRTPVAPWLSGWPPVVYADLYVVADFADLGALSHAAVTGPLRSPHDGAAHLAGHGTAGLYRRMSVGDTGSGDADGEVTIAFVDKRTGVGYDETLTQLAAPGRTVWLRQLTLGPGPELLVVTQTSSAPPPAPSWSAPAIGI